MNPILLTVVFALTTMVYPDSTLAQSATPTPTATVSQWALPTGNIKPYTYTVDVPSPSVAITAADLWEMARVALTAYNVIGGNGNQVWLLLGIIILVPVAGAIVYRLLVHPPDI